MILSARLKKRAAPILLAMVMAWMAAFATHIHTAKDLSGTPDHPAKCLYCSAFPAGAGPVEVALSLPEPGSIPPRADLPLPSLPAQAAHFYLSRAPPALPLS